MNKRLELRNRRNKKRMRNSRLGLIISSVLVVVLMIFFVKNKNTIRELKSQYKSAIHEQENLKAKIRELTKEVENANKLEYIEKKARENLGMIKPNEKIYITDDNSKNGESQDINMTQENQADNQSQNVENQNSSDNNENQENNNQNTGNNENQENNNQNTGNESEENNQ